jgi:hypothetical protein
MMNTAAYNDECKKDIWIYFENDYSGSKLAK